MVRATSIAMLNKEIIYWSYSDNALQIRAEEPINVFNNHFKKPNLKELVNINNPENYAKCPSFSSLLKNTYGLKSLLKYKLDVVNKTSKDFDQNFFNKYVRFRDEKSKLASLSFSYIFVAHNNNLEMEILPPFMETNSFTDSANFVGGVVNIGKYVRGLDCAFHVKNNEVNINEDDIYCYVKFRTNNKIQFKRFTWCDEIAQVHDNAVNGSKLYRSTIKPLDWFYKKQKEMKVKEKTIHLIKQNLI